MWYTLGHVRFACCYMITKMVYGTIMSCIYTRYHELYITVTLSTYLIHD